ncbi:uncharacterized protein V6R79_010822 [Siganus canaliculatus]
MEDKRPKRWIKKMYMSLSLLFLIDSSLPAKQGDFGIFTACTTKNDGLRLDCYYASCRKSPSFSCEFKAWNGTSLATASDDMCKYFVSDHRLLYGNKTTNYNCTLIRRKRREDKQITIDYSIRKGKHGQDGNVHSPPNAVLPQRSRLTTCEGFTLSSGWS